MKTKKGDLLNLWYILEALKGKKQNVKFSYFVAKNRIAIKEEVDALNEVQEASEAFQLYDTKRAELAASMADRVENSEEPAVINGQYVIQENKEKFEKQLEKLKKEFKKPIEEREAQIDAFKEILDEEITFKGHAISIENLPPDVEPAIMEGLLNVELILED